MSKIARKRDFNGTRGFGLSMPTALPSPLTFLIAAFAGLCLSPLFGLCSGFLGGARVATGGLGGDAFPDGLLVPEQDLADCRVRFEPHR
jgi:hypothetical protein